jgi:hypothetical protein
MGQLFDAIAHPLANVMLLFYSLLGHQTVLAITAITILINLLLLPLTLGQQKSAKRMQEIQPELEKLKKKHGNNREQFAQEQAKLFKEQGINPVGGCLPLLIQMPIWFGLYRAIVMLVPTAPLDVFEFSPVSRVWSRCRAHFWGWTWAVRPPCPSGGRTCCRCSSPGQATCSRSCFRPRQRPPRAIRASHHPHR